MSKHDNIAEYIDNISLKKRLCRGFRPDEVYAVICDLTSMYNQVLAEAYEENDVLKQKLKEKESISSIANNASSLSDHSKHTNSDEEVNIINDRTKDHLSETDHSNSYDDTEIACDNEEEDNSATSKELQRLKRGDLLEIIVNYSKENAKLKNAVASLTAEKAILQEKLDDKNIKINNAGTLAEATFLVNGVLESAQEAAKQYLDNLEEMKKREEENCIRKKAEANEFAEKVITNAQKKCDDMQKTALEKCSAMLLIANERSASIKKEADEYSSSMKETTRIRCRDLEAETRKKCDEMEQAAIAKYETIISTASTEADKVWKALSIRVDNSYRT